jgi:hypothetical protein
MIAPKKLKTVLFATAAAATLAMGLSAGSANATTLQDQLFYGELNRISDNNAETLIDNECDGCTVGIIDVGDVLTGQVSWNTIESNSGNGGVGTDPGGTNNELTGIFAVEVYQKIDVTPGDLTDHEFAFIFGPNTDFETEIGYTGAMVALWDDDQAVPTLYTRGISDMATEAALASDGSLVWVWGFDGDLDEQWVAVGDDNPDLEGGASASAVYNFQLSSLFDPLFNLVPIDVGCEIGGTFGTDTEDANPCLVPDGDYMTEIVGSGSILAPSFWSLGEWPVWTNTDADFFPVVQVPEPGTLGLIGFGLLGFGWLRRRMNRS